MCLRLSFLVPYSHVRQEIAANFQPDAVQRGRGADEKGFPVGVAPVDVAHYFGHFDTPQKLGSGADDPDAARASDIDVTEFVTFHAVRHAFREDARADVVEEHRAVRDGAIGSDVENPDMGPWAVV